MQCHVAVLRGEELDWSCIDLENRSFLYQWSTVEVIGFVEN